MMANITLTEIMINSVVTGIMNVVAPGALSAVLTMLNSTVHLL